MVIFTIKYYINIITNIASKKLKFEGTPMTIENIMFFLNIIIIYNCG